MERRQVTAAGEAPPRQQQQQQLPPGFRFHPTDVELIVQYLRRMVLARPLPAAVIPVVRTVGALPDPWDLPGASEGEAAYFFSQRQAPASGGGIGRRRRSASGYWKATGKEKPVFVQLQGPSGNAKRLLVGVKTALAFHRGKGKASLTRTDWVMHEYRLATAPGAGAADKKMTSADELQSCGTHRQAPTGEWVVCRVALRNRARRQALAAGETDDHTTAAVHRAAGDHHHQPPLSPSSSCVTDTCHASDHQEEVSSTY